jgi:hypothetical protein
MGNSQTIGETSLMLSTETKNNDLSATIYAAHIMLSQIDNAGNGCMHWLLMSIHKMLCINSEMSLMDFYKELAKICPERFATTTERISEIHRDEIGGDLKK